MFAFENVDNYGRPLSTLPFTYKVPKKIRDPRLVRGMPGYSLNRKTMFHDTINNSLVIQIFFLTSV